MREVFGVPGGGWSDFDRGTIDAAALAPRIASRTGLTPDEVRILLDAVPEHLQPIPETVDLLARLRAAGDPLYYLSNMPAPYARHVLRTQDFVGWFADGVFSSQVRLVKPEPAIFALAAHCFGVPAAQLMLLDDHPANVVAARAAGWNVLHFIDAAQAERDLRAAGRWPQAE